MEMDINKRIHLAIFVLIFLQFFYGFVVGGFGYLIYFLISLIVFYFIIYPDKFFHTINAGKSFVDRISNSISSKLSNNKNYDDINKTHLREYLEYYQSQKYYDEAEEEGKREDNIKKSPEKHNVRINNKFDI